MAPLQFYRWVDGTKCICVMALNESLTDNELKDIADRKMPIQTDKGKYRITSVPEEEWGAELSAGGKFRSFLVEVEPDL